MRWLKFNTVGIGGAMVQLCALWMLHRFTSIPYVFGVMLAVEIAILHNFVWHEAWTWRGKPVEDRWWRLLRFHLANGFVSIVSNVVLTYFYKEVAGLPLLAANFAAIVTAALLNFWVAHAWVFRGIVFFVLCSRLMHGAVITTTLQPQTVASWDKYIATFEHAPPRPLISVKGEKPTLIDLNVNGDVPDGFIHHWIGAELIPATTVCIRGACARRLRSLCPDLFAGSENGGGEEDRSAQLRCALDHGAAGRTAALCVRHAFPR